MKNLNKKTQSGIELSTFRLLAQFLLVLMTELLVTELFPLASACCVSLSNTLSRFVFPRSVGVRMSLSVAQMSALVVRVRFHFLILMDKCLCRSPRGLVTKWLKRRQRI